ncbi:LamG-like jellyroll fold domain-containing protein [Thalassoroseus pseudoceratinae]|uniref:LamG-like jellyroll fold domain-containing protein n=1 Tax=Thalassoroseus pseudoceratinae TaxID=2713176 RepID=UPI00141EBB4F|nr:LamG-like jellyroll fold domain-containing protein [Thalassoroseus pseudoceratinae]
MYLREFFACVVLSLFLGSVAVAQDSAVRWWVPYSGDEATGPNVLGLWKFDGGEATFGLDSSSHGHKATMRGATQNADGRFGKCLESSAGYPVVDESHSLHITRSPVLSPGGAFTVEMWIRGKDAKEFPLSMAPVLLDMKYIPANHTGFMLSLSKASSNGTRRLSLQIGTGGSTSAWYSDPFSFEAGVWQHVAFTYDARGTVAFFVNGESQGQSYDATAGPMATAVRPLSIGDRVGSLYRGFPGFIDEVRITKGIREFRPVNFVPDVKRFVYVRMSEDAKLTATFKNQTGSALNGAVVTARLPNGASRPLSVPDLAKGETYPISVPVDTTLKPGEYYAEFTVEISQWGGGESGFRSTTKLPFVIVPRPLPHQMPVVMWGIGGVDGVIKEIPRLKDIGFTHCLGLRCDYQKVWDDGADALPGSAETIQASREMLNTALEHDLKIVASLSPGRWLRRAKVGQPFLRINRDGKHYGREDISGVFPRVQQFCRDTGAAMSRAYGDHPAFGSALLHTEVRGESQVSFHPREIEDYQNATGHEPPPEVTIKNGVKWQNLADFPEDRVIADDNPILQYLQWFWKTGDGWNGLNTQLHEGLYENISHDNFWTFHDPAVRVPSISGSGGTADVLAHWTYSYPDPVRIGLCTDELFEMARVNGHDQDVMKMTQVIWYRSQTAPKQSSSDVASSPWIDQDPDADYISIAPMHMREAFWWKIARPIKGIMYHGWQSLVETDSTGAYRYTNPNTQLELKRLIHDIVEPLGPTLIQIPDAESDVAFLESFTSQMFARRGTYGWNHTWAGDMYHILMYAQLQPRVLYEESLLSGGLKGVKVLVMPDCDVLTESVVHTIQEFQKSGGLVVGDAEVCPAIKPDFVIPRFSRTKQADKDRERLQESAWTLRGWLDSRYTRKVDSTSSDVMTRRRQFGTSDYVFAVNDRRDFGTYVGHYRMVMEDGLPSETTIKINDRSGYVYDLVDRRQIMVDTKNDTMSIPLQLGPCEGRVLMITERPIREVTINVPEKARPRQSITMAIAVTDGRQPVDAVVPVEVKIVDPEGVESEFTGYHAATNGQLAIDFDFAVNDRVGVWEIRAKELASGRSAAAYVQLEAESDEPKSR